MVGILRWMRTPLNLENWNNLIFKLNISFISPSYDWFFLEEFWKWAEHLLQVISFIESSWFTRYNSNNEHMSFLVRLEMCIRFHWALIHRRVWGTYQNVDATAHDNIILLLLKKRFSLKSGLLKKKRLCEFLILFLFFVF